MEKFKSYLIAVAIVMALVLGLTWRLSGVEVARTVGVFFLGWIAGATSMFLKARIVYKP